MLIKHIIQIALLLFISTQLNYAQSYIGPKEDVEAILKNAENFSQFFIKGDMHAIVNSYTENGKIFPTGSDIMSGKEDLSMYWSRSPDMKAIHHKLTPLEIVISGERATDYGYFEGITQHKDNPPTKWRGKYVIIWVKVDGIWKMDVDIWNSIKMPTIQDKIVAAQDSIFNSHPGAIGSIVHVLSPDKNINWSSAIGVSEKGSKNRLMSDQPTLVASNTKTYVSAAIMRLVEIGKLKLDQPIKKLLTKPNRKLFQKAGYDLKSITLRHLLSHTSGITDYVDKEYFQFVVDNPNHRWTREEQMKSATKDKAPMAEPGTAFSYADVNFVLLTEIIEGQTKQPFHKAIKSLLKYEELDLNHTWFHTLEDIPQGTAPLPHQYVDKKGFDSYDLDPSWDLYGGGGIATTTNDLAKFYQHLFNGDIIKDQNLLDEMTNNVLAESNYCLGLYKIDFHGMEAYYHGGYWGTDVMYIPELNTTIAGFTLLKEERSINSELSKKIIELLKIEN